MPLNLSQNHELYAKISSVIFSSIILYKFANIVDTGKPLIFNDLLDNEKQNFKLLYEKVYTERKFPQSLLFWKMFLTDIKCYNVAV